MRRRRRGERRRKRLKRERGKCKVSQNLLSLFLFLLLLLFFCLYLVNMQDNKRKIPSNAGVTVQQGNLFWRVERGEKTGDPMQDIMRKQVVMINDIYFSQWFFHFDISTAEGRDSPLIASHYPRKASLTSQACGEANSHVSRQEKEIILVKD